MESTSELQEWRKTMAKQAISSLFCIVINKLDKLFDKSDDKQEILDDLTKLEKKIWKAIDKGIKS
jgi:hypothetical protein